MSRAYNIEVIYERKRSHTAVLATVCALLLVLCVGGVTGTLALQATQGASPSDTSAAAQSSGTSVAQSVVVNVSGESGVAVQSDEVKNPIELSEDWTPSDGLNLTNGSTITKSPKVENPGDACHLDMYLQIQDKSGRVLDPNNAQDAKRLELILGAIWADPKNMLTNGQAYTTADLKNFANSGVNNLYNASQFGAGTWDATAVAGNAGGNQESGAQGAYVFKYTGGETSGVFASKDSAIFFDHIVVPADYTAEDLALMGDFSIVVWAKATYDVDVTPVTPDPGPTTPDTPEPEPKTDPAPKTDPEPATDPAPKTDPAAQPATGDADGSKRSLAQTGDVVRSLMVVAVAAGLVGALLVVCGLKLARGREGGEHHE